MHELVKLLSVTGLLLDIIGVIVLAWDVLTIPGKQAWIGIYQTRIDNAAHVRDMVIARKRECPVPPYSKEKLDIEIRDAEEDFLQYKKKTEGEIEELQEKYAREAVFLGRRGVLWIVAGFVLQAIGVLLS